MRARSATLARGMARPCLHTHGSVPLRVPGPVFVLVVCSAPAPRRLTQPARSTLRTIDARCRPRTGRSRAVAVIQAARGSTGGNRRRRLHHCAPLRPHVDGELVFLGCRRDSLRHGAIAPHLTMQGRSRSRPRAAARRRDRGTAGDRRLDDPGRAYAQFGYTRRPARVDLTPPRRSAPATDLAGSDAASDGD